MIAADRACELMYTRLSGDSTLSSLIGGRVGREPILPAATGQPKFPYVSLGVQASTPLMTTNGTRVWENVVLRVSVWATMAAGQGWGGMRAISDRVDTLLQGYGGTTSGATVVKFRLISSTDMVEDDQGVQFLHRVLLYRTESHPS